MVEARTDSDSELLIFRGQRMNGLSRSKKGWDPNTELLHGLEAETAYNTIDRLIV